MLLFMAPQPYWRMQRSLSTTAAHFGKWRSQSQAPANPRYQEPITRSMSEVSSGVYTSDSWCGMPFTMDGLLYRRESDSDQRGHGIDPLRIL